MKHKRNSNDGLANERCSELVGSVKPQTSNTTVVGLTLLDAELYVLRDIDRVVRKATEIAVFDPLTFR